MLQPPFTTTGVFPGIGQTFRTSNIYLHDAATQTRDAHFSDVGGFPTFPILNPSV